MEMFGAEANVICGSLHLENQYKVQSNNEKKKLIGQAN